MKIGVMVTAGLGIILVGGLLVLRPVCMPLGQQNLTSFNVPAKQRTQQRDFYLKVWQEKGGRWYQCKTYLSRLLI